jgi:metal transporter CNNM
MWLTAIVSYPLSWLLDSSCGPCEERGIFTNDELAILIKYHERADKHGGQLGQDATRIILGALNLDARKIGGDITNTPEKTQAENEKDVEKADVVVVQGMIVKWSAVKTVNINDAVDKAFIEKVKSWSYSRIPVIGNDTNDENNVRSLDWAGNKIFGFFHIKVRA